MSTLAETFARVAKAVPEIRLAFNYELPNQPVIVKRLHWSPTPIAWNLRTDDVNAGFITPINEQHAEYLIIAACVRWLLNNSMEHPCFWQETAENSVSRFRVTCSCGWEPVDVHDQSLPVALLLAVEAVHGQKGKQ